ncbi:MAG TPA: hypothetical protein VGV15_08545, partial [Terriglobales bacterium]|nr:hypothetical protein [Terriglobales bacterium]
MKNGLRHWTPKGDSKLMYEFLPDDTSRQTDALKEAVRVFERAANGSGAGLTLLDLGCGHGSSYDVFTARTRKVRWIGLDIIESQ